MAQCVLFILVALHLTGNSHTVMVCSDIFVKSRPARALRWTRSQQKIMENVHKLWPKQTQLIKEPKAPEVLIYILSLSQETILLLWVN